MCCKCCNCCNKNQGGYQPKAKQEIPPPPAPPPTRAVSGWKLILERPTYPKSPPIKP